MNYRNGAIAGSLLFVAAVIDVLGIAAGGSFGSGLVWNLSVFFLGSLMITSVYFIHRALGSKAFSMVLTIAGIGTIGAALFCGCNGLLLSLVRDMPLLYYPFAVAGYLAFGFCAILSYKFSKPPFSYLCVILGIISLVAFGAWISTFKVSYSGTTSPSILVDYFQSVWLIGFSTYLLVKDSDEKPAAS